MTGALIKRTHKSWNGEMEKEMPSGIRTRNKGYELVEELVKYLPEHVAQKFKESGQNALIFIVYI